MKIPLSNAFDTHWAYVQRYMGSSVNVILRTKLDKRFSISELDNAIDILVLMHPYLVSKVCEETVGTDSQFFLETIDGQMISSHFNDVNDSEIDAVLNKCSRYRDHCFNFGSGELAHIEIWRDAHHTLIELSCAHLLTDVTGALILMSDFLRSLDNQVERRDLCVSQKQRLPFDEKRYGWKNTPNKIHPLPLPEVLSQNAEKWPSLTFNYLRREFSTDKFLAIKNYLSDRNIKAKVPDFFYYILSLMYASEYDGSIQTNVILSFRNLLESYEEINSINTLAVFAHVDMSAENLADQKSWIEYFYAARKKIVSVEEVIGFMNFFRCLNISMPGNDVIKGRQLLNTLLPVNSQDAVFVFNNYGVIDQYFSSFKRFKVVDIDVQDGVLAQEVRMFSFDGKVYFNMMFSPETVPFSVSEFWEKFNFHIDKILI